MPLNNDYAGGPYVNPMDRSRDNPFKPYVPVNNEESMGSGGEGQNYVAFIITMQDGFPVDFETENFSTENDANGYVETLKSEATTANNPQTFEGFVVPKKEEGKVERELIDKINGREPSTPEKALPKSSGEMDTGGGGWAGDSSTKESINIPNDDMEEIFEELERVCRGKQYSEERISNYLVRMFDLNEKQAYAVAQAYNRIL